MSDGIADLRFRQLIESPGGAALLVLMEANGISPREAVEPETTLHLVAQAVGALTPWHAHHDQIVERVHLEAQNHADLARALVNEPGIERWWSRMDLENQVWIEPEMRCEFPSPDAYQPPDQPPTTFEHYVQWPGRCLVTSTAVGEWTSQLSALAHVMSDWNLDYPASRKRVAISRDARIREIKSADDWHALIASHSVQSVPQVRHDPQYGEGKPWGSNDGLIPDWRAIAREWDGVHITLWALLTGTQVRVTSKAGWTELWSREAEETVWLRWVFDSVEDMPPVDQLPQGRHLSLPFDRYGVDGLS